jgi:hypothetical protein
MSAQRLLPVLLSVLLSLGVWFYGALRLQTDGVIQGGYAALVLDGSFSDGEIRNRLDGLGLKGLVSESDQWFLLDCFGYIEKVPLVMYEERLLPFDPRNDGYAEKLKNVFIRDGKRFIYIPLETNRPENLEIKIEQALYGIPYSLDYARLPPGRDVFLPIMLICLSFCVFLAIPVLRRRLNSGFLACLISLSPLALEAAPGFALISFLAGFAVLLTESDRKLPYSGGRRDLPRPFTARWLLAAALIACYGFFSFFSGLPVLFVFLVLASFCCVLAVSVKFGRGAAYGGINGGVKNGGKLSMTFNVNKLYPHRRRFNPVEIISRKDISGGIFPVMLPFAVMAIALAFAGFVSPLPPSPPAADVSPPPFMAPPSIPQLAVPLRPGAITEADFQEHYLFQSAFSFRALGKTYEDGLPPVIAAYELSSNGLLNPLSPGVDEEPEFPDFPLGDFLRGLNSSIPRTVNVEDRVNSIGLLLVPMPMLFIIPALILFLYGRKKGSGGQGLWTEGKRRPHADASNQRFAGAGRKGEREWGNIR